MKHSLLQFLIACLLLMQGGCNQSPESTSPPGNQAPQEVQTTSQVVEIKPLPNMVRIEPGTYQRGKVRVTISKAFWLGKYEVTQGEYQALMGLNPSHFTGVTNQPVEKVKFSEAVAYCQALTKREQKAGNLSTNYAYRLPTEAEWEYASKAATTNMFYFGGTEQADAYAWTLENSEGTPHPIGLKTPNSWGLYDMHGNVWEWTSDWFVNPPLMEDLDPVGPKTGKFKVFKGGGWNQAIEFARPFNKFMMEPEKGIHFVGFRIALGVVSP